MNGRLTRKALSSPPARSRPIPGTERRQGVEPHIFCMSPLFIGSDFIIGFLCIEWCFIIGFFGAMALSDIVWSDIAPPVVSV